MYTAPVAAPATWAIQPPPGFVAEFAKHTVDTAHRRQPELAIATGLALLATLCGRKVTDNFGTRCNIYFVALAGTGSGKEHPRQVAKLLLASIGRASAFCESFASSSGLVTRIHSQPETLALIDELGNYLRTMTGKQAAGHLQLVPTVLMRLYS